MKPGRVMRIPITKIEPNPHNPRRIFDEEPMKILQESIDHVGILVPLSARDKRDRIFRAV